MARVYSSADIMMIWALKRVTEKLNLYFKKVFPKYVIKNHIFPHTIDDVYLFLSKKDLFKSAMNEFLEKAFLEKKVEFYLNKTQAITRLYAATKEKNTSFSMVLKLSLRDFYQDPIQRDIIKVHLNQRGAIHTAGFYILLDNDKHLSNQSMTFDRSIVDENYTLSNIKTAYSFNSIDRKINMDQYKLFFTKTNYFNNSNLTIFRPKDKQRREANPKKHVLAIENKCNKKYKQNF